MVPDTELLVGRHTLATAVTDDCSDPVRLLFLNLHPVGTSNLPVARFRENRGVLAGGFASGRPLVVVFEYGLVDPRSAR
jgi:hypothetical protein